MTKIYVNGEEVVPSKKIKLKMSRAALGELIDKKRKELTEKGKS